MARAKPAPIAMQTRLVLTGVVAVTGAGLGLRLPPVITILAATLLLWQALAAYRGWRLPSALLRLTLTAGAFAVVFASVGLSGKQAGSSLLWLMLALKLCELRTHRDVMLVSILSCFLLVSEFLFSQAPWMVAYFLIGLMTLTTGFIHVNQGPGETRLAPAAREAAWLIVFAAPIMVLLFVVFPRIPGSLWGAPNNSQTVARTGLSNQMSPGAISRLVRSNGVAFRVRVAGGSMPPPNQRYWRGPVLWRFENGTWRTTRHPIEAKPSGREPARVADDNRVQMQITLAPTARHWLIGLDRPLAASHDSHRTIGDSLRSAQAIDKRIAYTETSTLASVHGSALAPAARRRALLLPASGDPKSRQLARRWARNTRSADQIIRKALAFFHDRRFYYTLEPPKTTRANSIDDFLFDTRRGFCAHYASAFTFLMRAAGLPARVVTGYQGATHASVGDYWIVRNADAHAWSEVWIAGRGWVRVDPTAAVAPSRIESGIDGALSDRGDLPFMARGAGSWLYRAGMAWDAVEAGWNHFVLGYGPDIQKKTLAALGLTSLRRLLIGLSIAISLVLATVSLVMAWQMRKPRDTDRVVNEWRAIRKRLAREGVALRNTEGPNALARRVGRTRPELGDAVSDLADDYIGLVYAGHDNAHRRQRFLRRARAFRRQPNTTRGR